MYPSIKNHEQCNALLHATMNKLLWHKTDVQCYKCREYCNKKFMEYSDGRPYCPECITDVL